MIDYGEVRKAHVTGLYGVLRTALWVGFAVWAMRSVLAAWAAMLVMP